MNRWLAVISILVVIAVIPIACHHKSGGEAPPAETPQQIVVPIGPGPQPGVPTVTFANPQQAATSTSAIDGTQVLSNATFSAVMALGISSKPAGFAPALSNDTGAIAKVDPSLAMMVKEMQRLAASPTVQKAVRKAGALKTALATAVSTSLTTEFCTAAGSVSIDGSNNYDEAANPAIASTYKIVFTDCKDDVTFTRLTGALTIDDDASTDSAIERVSLLAENLTMEQFSSAAFDVKTQTSVLNGAFVNDDQGNLSGSTAGGGTFVVTTPAGANPENVVTYTYDGLLQTHTHTHNSDATDTVVTTTKGSFKITSTSGGNRTFELNLAFDLTDQTTELNDGAGTKRSLLNGSIDMIFAPELASAGCQTGKVTISTVSSAPRVFNTAGGTCPQNGTVNINNATINYDPGQPIQVTIGNGAPQNFADCAAFDATGGSCRF